MNTRAMSVLGAAVLFGATAVYLARVWVDSPATPAEAAAPAVRPVVIARVPLGFGNALEKASLRVIPWPAEAVPAGSFEAVEELTKPGERRVVLRAIEKDEPILVGKISGPDGRGALSTTIADGMRAATIRVNDVLGVAGFVLPGDRVDIMITRREDSSAEPQTDILLQNIKVLGVDQTTNERLEGAQVARSVTLEVSPEDAQKLTLGQSVGTLSLALRNQAYLTQVEPKTVSVRDLRIGSQPESQPVTATPVVAPPREAMMRIVRGLDVSEDPIALPRNGRGL